MLFVSFGCVKVERTEIFEIKDCLLLDPINLLDGRIDLLLRPIFQYSNSSGETIPIQESWKIVCEPSGEVLSFQIEDSHTLIPTAGEVLTEEAKFSVRCLLPKETEFIVVKGTFIAIYPLERITAQLQEKKFPVTW